MRIRRQLPLRAFSITDTRVTHAGRGRFARGILRGENPRTGALKAHQCARTPIHRFALKYYVFLSRETVSREIVSALRDQFSTGQPSCGGGAIMPAETRTISLPLSQLSRANRDQRCRRPTSTASDFFNVTQLARLSLGRVASVLARAASCKYNTTPFRGVGVYIICSGCSYGFFASVFSSFLQQFTRGWRTGVCASSKACGWERPLLQRRPFRFRG